MPEPHDKTQIPQLALWAAAGGKIAPWAKKNDVGTRTAYRWSKTPRFRRLVEEFRRRAIDRGIGEMTRGFGKAVRRIVALVDNGKPDDHIRLSAARTLIDKLMDVRGQTELKAEVQELKGQLAAEEKRRAGDAGQHPGADRPASV